MKQCKTCEQPKPLEDFNKQSKAVDGKNPSCKVCEQKRMIDYSRTVKGFSVKVHQNMKHSSKRRGHPDPTFTRAMLTAYMEVSVEFQTLFNNWVASNYERDLAPSFDRQDETIGYTLANLKLMTWKQNNKRQSDARFNNEKATAQSKGVHKFDTEGNLIESFVSFRAAARSVEGTHKYIRLAVLNNDLYKGFSWKQQT